MMIARVGRGRALAAVMLGLLAAPLAAQTTGAVFDPGDAAGVVIVTRVPLGPTEATEMRNFHSNGDYFGAIAVDPGVGDFAYWVTGYQSQALAMEIAYAGCVAQVAEGADCVLHARIDPQGYLPRLGKPTELGRPASGTWREFYLTGQVNGKYAAFALSGISSGAAIESPTAAEAEGLALAECESAAAGAMKEMYTPARDAIRKGGHHVCRVVDVRGP
jgi:hypothetical protein